MITINTIKGHGSENDFFIIDNLHAQFDDTQKTHISILLCNRANALGGADGVLFMEKGVNTPHLMRIFNSDGSEALMCGNGMRLAGRWSLEHLQTDTCSVENITHIAYKIGYHSNFHEGVKAVDIHFPSANFTQDFINHSGATTFFNQYLPDVDTSRKYTAIAMPNPHIIASVAHIDDVALDAVGYEANHNKQLFPQGVNVSWMQIINNNTIFVSTYERGVGLTNSCGTAMLASAITGVTQGLLLSETELTIKNKGGFIKALVHQDNATIMTGNATYTAHYTIALDKETLQILSHVATTEQEKYEQAKTL
jgi:diaminopimelate epimerase